MNAPDRFELFLLPDGVSKITIEQDSRTPSTSIVRIEREDHTLANLLRAQLLKDEKVLFCAYKIEHPLFPNLVMRIQTEEGYPPRDALRNAIDNINISLDELEKKFRAEWAIKGLVVNEEYEDM